MILLASERKRFGNGGFYQIQKEKAMIELFRSWGCEAASDRFSEGFRSPVTVCDKYMIKDDKLTISKLF